MFFFSDDIGFHSTDNEPYAMLNFVETFIVKLKHFQVYMYVCMVKIAAIDWYMYFKPIIKMGRQNRAVLQAFIRIYCPSLIRVGLKQRSPSHLKNLLPLE